MYNMDSQSVALVLGHPATIILLTVVLIAVIQGLHKTYKDYINGK